MASRVLLLVAASLLSGCTSMGISLPRGFYLLEGCNYGILPHSQPARCMTRAEYMTATKKLRNSEEKPAPEEDKKTDPRYKEWIP